MDQDGSSLHNVLHRIYYSPESPGAFASAAKLYVQAKKEISDLKLQQVQEWLKTQLTYTLHKPARRRFQRNQIIVTKIDEQWEADLVDMQEFSRQNSGYKYILTIIDSFSKFAWVKALKSKTGKELHDVFTSIFNVRTPESLRTDKGKEFVNQSVQKMLKEYNIRYYSANNTDIKCAIVERFNRAFKGRMFRYFTAEGTRKYIDVLDKLIEGYNKSHHRSIRMAPIDVNTENSNEVFKNLYGEDTFRDVYLKTAKPKRDLVNGNTVRLKYKTGPFDKAFYPNWTDQVYKICGVDRSKARAVFKVKNYDGTERDKRKYYENELQHVNADTHRIEKILRRRRYKGATQYFVKWLGYPSSYNSWIDSQSLTSINQ